MKRLVCLILLALLLSGCAISIPVYQAEIPSATEPTEERQVVTVYYHNIYEENTEYPDGRTTRREYTYSQEAKRWLLQYTGCIFYENGQEVRREDYIRDQWDSIISIQGEDTTDFALTYENYKVVKKVISVNGAEAGWEAYTYNDQGLLTETQVWEAGVLARRTVTEYDSDGHRTKVTHYDGGDNITGYALCEYDTSTHKETYTEYDAQDRLLGYRSHSCDLHGNILIEEAYDPEDNLLYTTYRRIGTGTITDDIENLRTGRRIKK